MRPFMLAACWYLVPGVLWVVGSDLILGLMISDPATLSQYSALKGIVFVLITAFVMYRLLARQHAAHQAIQSAYDETERGFQLLFTNNPLPVWAYDRETLRFLEINDVALAKYGYSRDELVSMKVTDVHPPEEVPALLEVIRRPREVREVSGHWHHRLKDGRLIEVEVSVHDLELRGRPARVVVALDITERTQILEQQQRSAARARELAEAAIAINLASTADERLRVASQAARAIIGAHVGMTVVRSVADEGVVQTVIMSSETYAPWADTRPVLTDLSLRQQVCASGKPMRLSAAELRERFGTPASNDFPSGHPPMRGWLAAPLVTRDGEHLGLIQIADRVAEAEPDASGGEQFTDEDEAVLVQLAQMTSAAAENARLFQEVLERERRFRELVEGLEAIVWEADLTTQRFTFVSQQAETILGYPLASWTSADDVLERCFAPDDLQRVRAYLVNVAEGRHSIPCEVRARAANGTIVWLRIEGSAHGDATGTARHLRGLITNVTGERDQAERAARGEKLRALGQMSSGVAHDLNQSLALIAGYGELLQRMVDESPVQTERLREMLDVVVRAASDGGETVRRMLTFVRSPRDEPALPVDLTSIVQEVVRLTAPRWRDATQAEGRPIELIVELEGDVVIQGSAGPLREALTNLVLNAVDALPQGGSINLGVSARDNRALLSVTDNGLGMSDEVQARIFEPFFTTKGDRGTGLGLPTVFGIVEAHGGELSVCSEPGRGTRFELSFPLASHAEEASVTGTPLDSPEPQPASPEPDQPVARRILVVDDEPQLVRMLATMLRREGFDALVAGSGEEALAVLAVESVDLLITDVGMGPSMNGWDLAERAHVDHPCLPVILATGWGATIDPESARDRGICAILSKPYRRADLMNVLTRVPWTVAGKTSTEAGGSHENRVP